jgi:hypothetical protein
MFSKRQLSDEEQADAVQRLRGLLDDGVDAALKRGGEEGLTEGTLRRWLRARKWDVEHAAKDLRSHSEWRADAVPDGRLPEVSARGLAQALVASIMLRL